MGLGWVGMAFIAWRAGVLCIGGAAYLHALRARSSCCKHFRMRKEILLMLRMGGMYTEGRMDG